MKVNRIRIGFILPLLLMASLTGCNTTTVVHILDRQSVYQTAPLAHLEGGNYKSTISVQQFKSIGNFGIGIFENFDGEAILVNGAVFQAKNHGQVFVPPESAKLLLASCMLFDVEKRFTMRNVSSYIEFKKVLTGHYATNPCIRALQVEGTFNSITVSCNQRQEHPCKPFSQATSLAKKHTWKDVKGTLIGFWLPPSVPDAVMPAGFHLVFISEDRTKGGRVVDFESDKLILYFKQVLRMTINYTPNTTSHFDGVPL